MLRHPKNPEQYAVTVPHILSRQVLSSGSQLKLQAWLVSRLKLVRRRKMLLVKPYKGMLLMVVWW